MKKSNKKTPWIFRAGVILLCAMMISSHMVSGLYARYTTTLTGTPSSARVAKFGVIVYNEGATYEGVRININEKAIYVVENKFLINNNGEVSVSCDLSIRLSNESATDYNNPVAISQASLTSPQKPNNVTLKKISANGDVTAIDFASLTGMTYTAGKVYYAISSDGTDYDWYVTEKTADAYETVTLTAQTVGFSRIKYFKILYFLDQSTPQVTFSIYPSTLLYSIKCEQVD